MVRWIGPISLYLLFSSNLAFASGGFTFLSSVSHLTHIPEHIITFTFVGLLILCVGVVYRSQVSNCKNVVIPDSRISIRSIVEAYGQFIYNQCRTIIGEHEGPKYFPFISILFLTILLNNLMGLVPGFLPATSNLNTTFALGVCSFVFYNIQGCREQGTWNYIKHFMGPLWYMAVLIFPIEIISNLVRPMSLGLRLWGNITGDHTVMDIFSELVPAIVPIAFLVLGLVVSIIQAFVFSILSMVYISLATAHHDHDEH